METDTALQTRMRFPDELRQLLQDYPRGTWETHQNFDGLVAFWLDRHMMFRKLTETIRTDAEAAVDKGLAVAAHQARLSRFGSMLVQNLHGHHQIEDHHYFPKLIGLESRLKRGFDILDKDHHAMDGLLEQFTKAANSLIGGQLEPGKFLEEFDGFGRMLNRHLEDEEDLIVPVILRHGPADLA